jgi:hypothetical protein
VWSATGTAHQAGWTAGGEAGLVGLHDQYVVGLLDADQLVGVGMLGVERIGSDHDGSEVQPLQQRLELSDLLVVCSTSVWPKTAWLVWSIAASRCTAAVWWWPLPRRVLPSTATARCGRADDDAAGRWDRVAAGRPAIGQWPGPARQGRRGPGRGARSPRWVA